MDEDTCGFCFQNLDAPEIQGLGAPVVLCESPPGAEEPWRHRMHRNCLNRWLQSVFISNGSVLGRFNCPICRRDITALTHVPPGVFPAITFACNTVTVALSANLVRSLFNHHMEMFSAASLPVFPNGIQAGAVVPAGWAEMAVPAPMPAHISNGLWGDSRLFLAIVAFALLYRIVIAYARRRFPGGPEMRGGSLPNILYINDEEYPLDPEIVPVVLDILNILKKYVSSTNTRNNTTNRRRRNKRVNRTLHVY